MNDRPQPKFGGKPMQSNLFGQNSVSSDSKERYPLQNSNMKAYNTVSNPSQSISSYDQKSSQKLGSNFNNSLSIPIE